MNIIVKRILIAGGIVLAAMPVTILVYLVAHTFIFGAFLVGHITAPEPKTPEIKNAAFPYEITYSVNGDQYTATGEYVCNYCGIDYDPGSMGQKKERIWLSHIKNTEQTSVTLYENDEFVTHLYLGYPGYYMGDPEFPDKPVPKITHYCRQTKSTYSDDQAKEYFGTKAPDIKIIDFIISPPVENTFK